MIKSGVLQGGEKLQELIERKPSIHKKRIKVEKIGTYKELTPNNLKKMKSVCKKYGDSLKFSNGKFTFANEADIDIALNTLSALDSLQSTIGVEGTSKDRIDFDFSKLFVDKTAVEVNEYYKTKYNSVKSASKETTQEIVKELESYMFMDSTKGYNNLAAGERLVFNNYVADAIAIAANPKGVSMSSAFDTTINETTVTDYINSLTDKMNCLAVTEAEKVLTK